MHTRKFLITFLILCSLAITGCSGQGESDEDSGVATLDNADTTSESDSDEDDEGTRNFADITEEEAETIFAEYEQCMTDHGLPEGLFSDATGAAVDGEEESQASIMEAFAEIDEEVWAEAEEACNPLLEEAFGDFEFTPEQEAAIDDANLAFEQCLADHGVELPEPDPESDEDDFAGFPEDLDDEIFEECITVFDELDETFEESEQ